MLTERLNSMRPLPLATLALAALAACSADPNGLGEQAVDPPFPLPGQCSPSASSSGSSDSWVGSSP